ncbi:MAG: hypothetical protein SFY95_02750 [Planctomycetota bacterium]|nr:hypothetical protein [Planctomycetota bacterium]
MVIASLALLGSATFLYLRWRPPAPVPAPQAGPSLKDQVEQSQKAMARFAALPLERFTAPEATREWFMGRIADAEIDQGPQSVPPKPGEVEAVVAESAEFFYYRFCQPEAQVYIDWRARKGYRFRSDESMEKNWQIRRDAAISLERPIRPDETLEDLYREMWPFATGQKLIPNLDLHGVRPRALLDGAGSFRVQFFVTAESNVVGMKYDPASGLDVWDGLFGGTVRRWWTWPFSLEERLRSEGKVRGARVGWIVEDEADARCAMIAIWLWDTQSQRWWLWEVKRGVGPKSTQFVLEI